MKKNYGNAGNTSANAFSEKLDPILDDTALKLANLNKTSTTIKITADTSDADWKLSNLSNKTQNLIGNSGTGGIYSILGKANGGVYSNGSWKNIPQYANGGIPSHGSMFVAGEAGAEIVGHINGRTEVLNQSQIASAIYSAVYSAMSQFSSQSGEIEVHVHTDEGTVIDRIEQRTKQTGKFPLTIPTY